MTGMKILWGPKLWDFMVCSEDPWRLRWNVSVRATVVHIACVSHIAPSFRIINAHCPETSLIDNKSLTWVHGDLMHLIKLADKVDASAACGQKHGYSHFSLPSPRRTTQD